MGAYRRDSRTLAWSRGCPHHVDPRRQSHSVECGLGRLDDDASPEVRFGGATPSKAIRQRAREDFSPGEADRSHLFDKETRVAG